MSYFQRDEKYVWHPYTAQPYQGPKACFVRAEGAYVYDENQNAYLDAVSSWWSQLHGHCHPDLVRVLSEQAASLDQVLFAPHTHPVAVELAEKLVGAMGAPMARVFFSDNGSTAVEAALKMSVQYWHNQGNKERRYFLSLTEGYHGDTLGAISVGYLKEFHHYFDEILQPALRTEFPYCLRCPVGKKYPSCDIACLESTKKILDEKGDSIAALIVEPLVMGAGGMVMYPKAFLEQLITMCRAKDIHIIFDEVFTGFGRTGTLFAMDQLSQKPDMVCLSKGLTSGMLPMGATVTSEELYLGFQGGEAKKFYHGHTFTGNAISAAVALESLRIFERDNVLERNQALISVFEQNSPRFSQLPHVGEVRHLGMIWAIELVVEKRSLKEPSPGSGPGWRITEALWEKGIWIRPLDNILYLVPPYCVTEQQLRECLELLYREVRREEHFESNN